MLLLSAIWLFVFFVSFSLGFGFLSILKKLLNLKLRSIPVSLVIFSGLSIASTIAGFWSLWGPIDFYSQFAIFGLAWACLFWIKEDFLLYLAPRKKLVNKTPLWWYLPLVFLIFICLIYGASEPSVYDTGLYHAQAIQWIEKYGVVPGLGNLHGRFAFNNHNFLLSALFALPFARDQEFFSLNSSLFLIFLIHFYIALIRGIRRENTISATFHGVVLFASLYYLPSSISSPTADVTTALLFLLASSWIVTTKNKNKLPVLSLLVCLAVFAFSVKLSAVLLLLMPLALLEKRYLNLNWFLLCMSIGTAIALPFIFRNFILSGYPIYPLTSIDPFFPDWKIPVEQAINEINAIKSWAKVPYADPEVVLAMSVTEWLPAWWSNKSIDLKVLLLVNLLSPVMYTYWVAVKRNVSYAPKLGMALVANVIFWVLSAPDVRFAFGALISNAGLSIALLAGGFKTRKHLLWGITFAFAISYLLTIPAHLFDPVYITDRVLLPSGIAKTEVVRKETYFLDYTIPAEGDRCYNTPLPCAPGEVEIELRGSEIKSGFKPYDFTLYNMEARRLLRLDPDHIISEGAFELKFYLKEHKLLVSSSDREAFKPRFFLHLFPDNEKGRAWEFINGDFGVTAFEPPFQYQYFHVENLPDMEFFAIGIGQFNDEGRLWRRHLQIEEIQ